MKARHLAGVILLALAVLSPGSSSAYRTDYLFDTGLRSQFGAVVHLYGDSIIQGYGFGNFKHPSFLNTVQGICMRLLDEAGIPPRRLAVRACVPRPGQDPYTFWFDVRTEVIKDGDVVVFENAGEHFSNAAAYAKLLDLIIFSATHDSTNNKKINDFLVLTTTPDYGPGKAYYNSSYDEPLKGSGKSINQVVMEAVKGPGVGLLDWNKMMDRAVSQMKKHKASPMHDDNVHPNVFGNFLLATSLMQYLGVPLKGYRQVEAEFMVWRPLFKKVLGFELSESQVRKSLAEMWLIARENPKAKLPFRPAWVR